MTVFMKIELPHRKYIEELFVKYPPQISEHTFTNLFIWRASRPIYFIQAEGGAIFYTLSDGWPVIYGYPVGNISVFDALELVKKETGKEVQVVIRAAEPLEIANWKVEEDRDNFDYIYLRSDMANLEGRKYHAKRNLITNCLAENNCEYEEISQKNLNDVVKMMQLWCAKRNCAHDSGLCSEFQAIRELFDNYTKLNVFGALVRINGQVAAFTIGEKLNNDTAVIHIEKAMPEFKGLYQVINNWFCAKSLSNFKFVNREQDLGIEGLRKAKESYFPLGFVKKYNYLHPTLPKEYKFSPDSTLHCGE